MTIAGNLRGDEELVITSLAKEFSATWRPGENPPDAYFSIGAREIAVEISTLTQHITDDRGTRPHLSDDTTTAALVNDLNAELQDLIPDGHTIYLVLSSPILKYQKTKAELAKMLRERLSAIQSFTTHTEIGINGNLITIFGDHYGHNKKVLGIFPHRNSNPNILSNAWQILEDRITIKARKCAPLAGRRALWLALLNDYWLADSHTYKDAFSRFSLIHPFEKILLVHGGGTIDSLYSATREACKAD